MPVTLRNWSTLSGVLILTHVPEDYENGRGLILVDALSREWSYFYPPGGGKVVYCFLEIR